MAEGNVTGSVLSVGTEINSVTHGANGVGAQGWNAKNKNVDTYYEYSIAPLTGYDLQVSSITLTHQASDEMFASIDYSLDGVTFINISGGSLTVLESSGTNEFPINISVLEGQTLTVRVYGWDAQTPNDYFYNQDVVITGTTSVITTPLLSVSPSNLNFGYIQEGTESHELHYELSGTNLDLGSITITAPQYFSISTTSGTGYSGSLTLNNAGGTLSPTTIYVKFTPPSVAGVDYSDNISHSGGGASILNLSVSGTTVATCVKDAFALESSTGVPNASDALGPQDNIGAELHETGDQLVLDITGGASLSTADTVEIYWSCSSNNKTATVWVEVSEDGTTWVSDDTYDIPNANGWYSVEVIPATDARYIRFTSQSEFNVEVDALVYDALPSLTCPSDITVDNDPGECGAVVNYTTPVGSDNCPGTITTRTSGFDSGATFPIGTTPVTYEATDASGQTVSCSFNVIVNDTESPIISCFPDTTVVEESGVCGANITLPLVTVTDNCPGTVTITNDYNAGGADASGTYPLGVTTVTFTVTDVAGNSSSCSVNILVYPEADNVISAGFEPSTGIVSTGDSVDFNNNAENNSATSFLWLFPGATPAGSTSQNPTGIVYDTPGTYTVTLTVVNGCETTTQTGTITVVTEETQTFTSDGVFTVPACVTEIAVHAWGGGGGGSNGGGGGGGAYALKTIENVKEGDVFAVSIGIGGAAGVAGGNTSFETNLVVAAGGENGDGNNGGEGGKDSGSIGEAKFSGGNGGNLSSFNFIGGGGGGSATTTADGGDGSNGSIFGAPGGVGVGNGGSGGAFWTEAENGEFPGGGGGAQGSGTSAGAGADGVLVVTWSVNDSPELDIDSVPEVTLGNPTASIYYSNLNGNPASFSLDYDANAESEGFVDIVDAPITASPFVVGISTTAAFGTYLGNLTLRTADGCESTTYPVLIKFEDNEPPVITCPPDLTVSTDSACFATDVDLLSLIATDNAYSGTVSSDSPTPPGRGLTITNDAPDKYSLGVTIVTWTVTDEAGNSATCQQIVTVEDNEDPVPDLATLPDTVAECVINILTEPTASDNCAGILNGTPDVVTPITTQGTTVVTWTYDDGNGNTITQTQNVILNDTTAPVPDLPILPVVRDECKVTTLTPPTAIDNCGGAVTVTNDATLPITDQGTTVVTWTYEDANGNKSTQTQNVVIDDVTDPTITCPADITESVDAGACSATVVNLGTPVTSDNCGVFSVVNDAVEPFVIGTTTVTWTVTDIAGNTASCSQNVSITSEEQIDIEVVSLSNSCQNGQTGTTTFTWDITKLAGTDDWTYDYAINDGTSDVETGSNENANGNIEISYTITNTPGVDQTFTLTISNVKDNCGVAEIDESNNGNTTTLYGVPNTGEIITDN